MIRYLGCVFSELVRPVVEEALIGVGAAQADRCIRVAVVVEDGGGSERGIGRRIVYVDGEERNIGEGGSEQEGCDVTV